MGDQTVPGVAVAGHPRLGRVALRWRREADGRWWWIEGIDLPPDSRSRRARGRCGEAATVLEELLDPLRRSAASWALIHCDWQGCGDFERRVLCCLAEQIGAGQTITYGGLAALAGQPRAARAVGGALRRNPFPLLVPCHRVVGQRDLGGFQGGSEGAMERKRWLLLEEGVVLSSF